MNVAVLTLTRDRLSYSQHCFESLRQNAGCDYDHFVLDQGSKDGTQRWLQNGVYEGLILLNENIGCTKGWNRLLELCDPSKYDVIVCFDNDCEVVTPDTLKVVSELVHRFKLILAPRVDGLLYPPPAIARFDLDGYEIEETLILGNIFMAIPAEVFGVFRWDETYAVWDGGESITQWLRARGGRCGYVSDFRVNHYLTTMGQKEDMPWYAERRVAEGGRAQ
jgi:hypothetical protein